MAVQSKLPEVFKSSEQFEKYHSSGTLKLKPFNLKNIPSSSPIPAIAKKPTGKSWVVKDILYHKNSASNISKEMNELANLINTKFHL